VRDDGSLETGYGWVPSAVDGRYVQQYESTEFATPILTDVCVCWARTRAETAIDFEVQLYRHEPDGPPRLVPEFTVSARAENVPSFPAGTFYRVSIPSWRIPEGRVSIGVKWDPMQDQFFFLCADQSAQTPFTEGWFIDDRADEWAQFSDTNDPIFDDHSALLIRPVVAASLPITEVPLGRGALAVLALALSGVGVLALRS
jgi:hypothetical protein